MKNFILFWNVFLKFNPLQRLLLITAGNYIVHLNMAAVCLVVAMRSRETEVSSSILIAVIVVACLLLPNDRFSHKTAAVVFLSHRSMQLRLIRRRVWIVVPIPVPTSIWSLTPELEPKCPTSKS